MSGRSISNYSFFLMQHLSLVSLILKTSSQILRSFEISNHFLSVTLEFYRFSDSKPGRSTHLRMQVLPISDDRHVHYLRDLDIVAPRDDANYFWKALSTNPNLRRCR